jgi:hypothetical protein
MVINEELYKNLIEKEKTEKKEKKYIKLCLKNKVCPVCGSPLIPLEVSGNFRCEECDYIKVD